MARKTILMDDLSDADTLADETVHFALDGEAYEIDLTTANALQMRGKLAPYLERGRKVGIKKQGKRQAPKAPMSSGLNADQLNARRTWARANGFELSARGRVPQNILDAFDQAHGGANPEFLAAD